MKRALLGIGTVFFAILFVLSGTKLWKWYMESRKSRNDFAQITELLKENNSTGGDSFGDIASSCYDEETKPEILEEYRSVYEKNPDFAGWISIEDTKIDYPVMQSKTEPDFYLDHNFEKENSSYGVPYIQADCELLASDNLILYGHHMKNNTMFSDLCRYEDREFYNAHKTIRFDTKYSYGIYEIVAVFKTTATENGFPYYQFVNAENEEEFSGYINTCKKLSLYDTDGSAAYGDRLITLSTCEYSRADGRMVLVAKLIQK